MVTYEHEVRQSNGNTTLLINRYYDSEWVSTLGLSSTHEDYDYAMYHIDRSSDLQLTLAELDSEL